VFLPLSLLCDLNRVAQVRWQAIHQQAAIKLIKLSF
jgi:hypothetical protein